MNIGLMMTYNEEDIIEEVMDNNKKYFDKILVLDGSTDNTPEIIRSYSNVVYYLRDEEIFPRRKTTDFSRQFLMEEAQRRYGYEGWFSLLHGDEIMVDDPNQIIQQAESAKADIVNWHALNFFLHTSQKNMVFDPHKSVQEQVTFYQPGGLEIRQFKNQPGIYFKPGQMRRVLPYGLKNRPLLDYPIFKHYVFRSLKQINNKGGNGLEVTRDINKAKYSQETIFKDQVAPGLKVVLQYDGNFHEFEPGQRPPFIKQWLSWHKYREMDWGVAGLLIPGKHKYYRRRIFGN